MRKILSLRKLLPLVGGGNRSVFLRITLFMLMFVSAHAGWAETANFTFSTKWSSNTQTVTPVTVTFGGSTISRQTGYTRVKRACTISFSAESGYNITGISVTYTTDHGKFLPTSGQITSNPSGISSDCTSWSGTANEVVFSVQDVSGYDFDITNISVTYEEATSTDAAQDISIEDLRFLHQTYNPSRTNVAGFDITTSGWQSFTTVSGSTKVYSLLLSNTGNSNSITIAPNSSSNSTRKIKQVVLYGGGGATTFDNATVTSANTTKYSSGDVGALVWENTSGASSATISINSTDRPHIVAIRIVTDGAMISSKQDVVLSFNPNSGSAAISQTDFSLDGDIKASIGGGSAENFRPDDFTASSVSGAATFNQFHISTSKVGVDTDSSPGTATITASFAGNDFYNAATAGIYTLTVADNTPHTLAVTIDDMRFSKKSNSNGLNATSGLDRQMGGFNFAFTGDEGVKFNNGDFLIFRVRDDNKGTVTITPESTGTVNITRVDISTLASYTNGTVSVNNSGAAVELTNVSSYSFTGGYGDSFAMSAQSGDIYVTGFTIYYTVESGVLNTAKVTPAFAFSKSSDTIGASDNYSSPTISTTPANFDFTLTSNDLNVANVASTNWTDNSVALIGLQGNEGTATITASAAESTFFNAAEDATYTVTVNSTNSKKWDFTTLDVTNTINEDDWTKNGDYYQNAFTTSATAKGAAVEVGTAYTTTTHSSSQISGLLFGRENSNALATKAVLLYSSYMTFNNSAVVIGVPAKAGESVIVTFDGGNGTTETGFDFTNATLEGGESATSITSDATQKTVTLIATADGYVTLKALKSKVKLYSIEVKSETRSTLTFTDTSNSYERYVGTGNDSSTDNHFNHRVKFTPADGAENALTYASDNGLLHITSSDPSVLDVSNVYISESNFGQSSSFYFNNIVPKGAGTATLTVTFDGNNSYKATSYTSQTYTVYGPVGSFKVSADDQSIQRGQFSDFSPIITDDEGNPLGIREMGDGSGRYTTYILDEEENIPDYTTYFDFTYTAASTGTGTNWNEIQVDVNGHITTETDDTQAAEPGASRQVTITAVPNSSYSSAFTEGSTATKTVTLTIIEKVKEPQIDLYWDAACTQRVISFVDGTDEKWKINANEAVQEEDKLWHFKHEVTKYAAGFPNGRVLYAKAKNDGDAIFFSFKQNDAAATIPANPSLNAAKGIYQYRRGIPIYIDETLSGSDYVTVNIVAASYDGNTKKYNLNGSVVRMRFDLVSHDRPATPTYEPTSPDADPAKNNSGRKIMNTAQSVVAYGEGASSAAPDGSPNLVYGKFSTGSVYATEQLINEANVQLRVSNVPVVSTEVNKRRFTSVQIENVTTGATGTYDEYGDYISEQTYTEYHYLYDTEMRLTPASYNINPNTSTTTAPTVTVTWYNKKKGAKQEVDSYAGKISYAITGTSGLTEGTDVSVNAETGIVTSSTSNQGWVKVTATYAGGESHGGSDKSGEPTYESTTDKSTADFYVYIYDPDKERPVITPTSRNFTGKMTYTIKAPTNWDVIYTNDRSAINPGSTTVDNVHYFKLENGQSIDITIGEGDGVSVPMSVGDVHTVKAFAYNPDDASAYSATVVESYSMKAPLPDPVFDPNGVGTPYIYNTHDLTVSIACPYPGAVIYYTISDLNEEHPNPEIGADNTYIYSGLSKVTVEGEQVIKAVAYDPVQQIFSNIVTSTYRYSTEMAKPYFQISNDGGTTWWGMSGNTLTQNATEWHEGQSADVTPSTQIRIIDPNPVTGTIYYTVNGTTPSSDASSLIYFEGYPFTVGRTTTAQAITTLEDAVSQPATATFTINSSSFHVWEAVDATLNAVTIPTDDGPVEKKGIDDENGFVISQVSNLPVANTATKVNAASVSNYAQPDITATFGGYDKNDWEEMVIADAAIGTPLDAVGTYNIRNSGKNGLTDSNDATKYVNNGNAQDETMGNYHHAYMTRKDGKTEGDTPTTHDKTFKVPAAGTFVRFEPERDGDLTVWVLQQGAVHYEDDKYLIPLYIRLKPVYLIDEQGKSYQVKKVNGVEQLWSAARLSENWSKLQATAAANGGNGAWADWSRDDGTLGDIIYLNKQTGEVLTTKPADYTSEKYKEMENKGLNRTESQTIFNIIQADLDKNHVQPGDPIKPFAVHTGTSIALTNGKFVDSSDDGTGYVLASGGYAKYTFELKAGKTYYFLATNTKVGIRGFQFVPTETGTRPEVEIEKTSSNVKVDGAGMSLDAAITACKDKTVNVTLKGRKFTTNWTTLVLPFSVSVAQIEKVFGAQTDIIHFDDITADTNADVLNLKRHWYKMIVAGTPVLIKPTQEVNEPKFEGVQLETCVVDEILPKTRQDYKMTGTMVRAEGVLQPRDYYVNSSGNITWFNSSNATAVNSGYGWFQKINADITARPMTLRYSSFLEDINYEDEDNVTTDLRIAVYENMGVNTFGEDDTIYNLNGIKVGTGATLQQLPKGVYIVNGKKVAIK